MEIRIQSVNFDADAKLVEFTRGKVQKLGQFFDRITNVDVYLKLEGESSHIKDKKSEIKLNIPGNTLYAQGVSKTFEESVDHTVESLRKQLVKYKEKIRG